MRNAATALPLVIALLGGATLPESMPFRSARSLSAGVPPVVAASRFAVHFIDVGTGDAVIIDIGDTEILIDGGESVRVLTDYVTRTGIVDGPIELLIVTHADTDHWKGLPRLLGFDGKNPNPPQVLEFWEPGYNRDCRPLESYDLFISNVEVLQGLRAFRRPLQDTRIPAVQSHRVDTIRIPSVQDIELSVLHTNRAPEASSQDCAYLINNACVVFSARVFNHRFLFTGDANGKERDADPLGTPGHIEKLLLDLDTAIPGTLASHVLKVPHHGSETANTQAFIDHVHPDFAIVSSSTRHALPRESVVARYDNSQRVILRTDLDPKPDNDHVICFETEARELNCDYEWALDQEAAAIRCGDAFAPRQESGTTRPPDGSMPQASPVEQSITWVWQPSAHRSPRSSCGCPVMLSGPREAL